MKKLLLLSLFLIASIMNAQVTLGSGTSQGGYVPVDVNYGYNYTQQIFTKSEINASAAGTITGMKFYLPNNADISKSVDWVVYVAHTTKTSFSSTSDWIPVSGMTQVFAGTVSASGGEVIVNFTTPFAYNNTDNLVFAIDENTADYTATTNKFYTYTGPSNSTLYNRSDTVNPDPASPPTGSRTTTKSVTGLLGLTPAAAPACPAVSAPAAAATNVSVMPTITWTASNYASSYKISMGTTPGGTNIMNMQDVGITNSYTLTSSLSFNTQYYYTVYAVNSAGTSTACAERSFTTMATLGCPSVTAPTSAQVGVPVLTTFSWSAVSGALGYRLSIGTSAGASNVLSNFDMGNVTAYTLTPAQQLNPTTQYYYTITAYNGGVVSTGCTERNFTTTVVPPVNDNCSGAVDLTVNPSLTCTATTPGNTLGATESMAAGTCFGGPNDDVWYKFTATAASHVIAISNITSTGTTTGTTDMYFQVLSGNCGTFTSLLCSDAETNIVTGLTPGQTYYVRVYTYSTTVTANASFNICVSTPPPPPANDDCANAVAITINPDMSCTSITSGTTLGGTSSGVALGSCSGTADDDVWYKFIATGTGHTFQLKNVVSVGTASTTSLYAQIFSGACGALVSTTCISSNTNFTNLTGLTAGQTYYVRVYTYDANSGASFYANSFDICMGTLPAAPANDECSAAVSLSVNPTLACATPVSGTTLSATNSGLAVSPCTGTADDDVWYKFTATGTDHVVMLSNVTAVGTSSSTSLYTQVFSGVCGTLTSIKCGTSVNTPLTGLTAGQTYYVRVYNSNTNGTTLYANSFNICIGTPPPPPANDDCANATALSVSSTDAFLNAVNGSTVSATQSSGVTAPTCSASGVNDDVWYSFTATAATHLVHVLYTDNATSTQIYSGACGALTAMTCFDGAYGNSNILLQNLAVGQTYYVRVYSSTSTATTTSNFQIAVTTPSPVANDTCDTATAIACNGTVQGVNALAGDETLPASSCGSTGSTASYKGVWYTVKATENGPITIDACGTQYDAYLRVYTGTCGSLTCFSNSSGVGYADAGCTVSLYNAPTLTFTGVAGTTYYILLTGYTATRVGNYSISVTQGCSGLATAEVEKKNNEIKAYPNPFVDVLNISDAAKVKSASVVDTAGRVVKTIDNPSSTLHFGDLKQGMYLVVLNMKDGSKQTIKAIKR
ncbi:T9SS type A sorting domain-containing protein [Chryseobacterium cucumeris]|uniref:T9SS C-terminal target domain-containing protein n=1 Tax=Chryseobacterium cucumeris TaxID=1813611 RepID=A0ABX9XA68_9FLAO|nr:T9SS type A sorting domain-containing protein [Chryseobacterium cucumeris]MDH5034296.1 T9SS type A sorting domain-containing protein [Chryseobacterium cucumeris]ROH95182.1 T9SS C-terminal target domain-containing protein [Chryseobacterium cucumeris]